MMKRKHVFAILLALLSFSLLSACGGYDLPEDCLADEYYDYEDEACYSLDEEDNGDYQLPEDCLAGEVYDYQDQLCYLDETTSEDYGDYYQLPEDCWDDEYYDEQDQLCYLLDSELDGDLLTLFFDLVDEFAFGGGGGDFDLMSEQAIITYEVQGNKITNPQEAAVTDELLAYQEDIKTQQEIWIYFASLIPLENRSFISQYSIFTDGPEEVMAAVEQDREDPEQWVLAVDIADAQNPEELTYTLIHEYGHLLSLNAEQVPPDETLFNDPENEDLYNQAVSSCSTYFPGEGCSQPDSYINQFFERFWTDIYGEWDELNYIEDDDAFYQMLDDLYYKYQDRFVTDYAATNPGEDIAESWTHFVLKAKPTGNAIADQKVLFFYEWPELVKLRADIVSRTYTRLRR